MPALLVEEVASNGETIRSRIDLTHYAAVLEARRRLLNWEEDEDGATDDGARQAPRATE